MMAGAAGRLPGMETPHRQELAKKAVSMLSHKGPPPTWTDIEMCQGCQALMEVVIRSTSAAASVRDIMFAIHSACNNQPEVFNEACMHATHYDANLAILRQQSSDIVTVCKQGGMCG
ncbi:hypothetical protein FNF27_00965 [Cafeteria roenbergensis]|uniref:Saposin B-type domain-containing protein n=2 Tax=Cafeteria roenbergensis TaxID=33653 RepID=A0A5A8CUN7_CAFRO|nr:hypothetical protein FNF29_01211 [Cafeteria roenbergensis]KAA0177794.1 hypothetical protein FNF27_00965 [Cafeteria roenbergensis]|eukprot:KAA0156419.1 hypothetical protein FNF29_01211 [Cafeteria roenbergensis]